jgi:hypothetical protein
MISYACQTLSRCRSHEEVETRLPLSTHVGIRLIDDNTFSTDALHSFG